VLLLSKRALPFQLDSVSPCTPHIPLTGTLRVSLVRVTHICVVDAAFRVAVTRVTPSPETDSADMLALRRRSQPTQEPTSVLLRGGSAGWVEPFDGRPGRRQGSHVRVAMSHGSVPRVLCNGGNKPVLQGA
jgi:hypothetical protein